MAGVSDLTRTIDDAFTHTWYEIRPMAIDNILDSNVVTAALRMQGCFTAQTGGDRITRTIKYGKKTNQYIKKGDTLEAGEDDIETMAWWDWKYDSAHIQRSLMDDQKNNGKSKIKSLVKTKTKAAIDALDESLEDGLWAALDTTGTAKEVYNQRAERTPNSLFNIFGTAAKQTSSYKWGNITRDNAWWKENYKTANDPIEVNLLSDMRNLFNTCGKSKSYPTLLICDQTVFEVYEEYAQDITQIVKSTNRLADLGYEVLKFKGRDIIWSEDATAGQVMMLNCANKRVEIVYDPALWYDMTEWKVIPLQTERIAHIVSAFNLICSEMRRQGLLGDYT